MIERLLGQLFSGQCQLKSLRVDICNIVINDDIHRCLRPYHSLSMDCCFTLRRLYIRIKYACFIENLIEHVPNLERLSVQFQFSLEFDSLRKLNIEIMKPSTENWLNKVR